MKLLKKIWAWLDGRKRTLAAGYWLLWIPVMDSGLIWSDVPHDIKLWSGIAGVILTAIGLGHAMIKKIYPTADLPEETKV